MLYSLNKHHIHTGRNGKVYQYHQHYLAGNLSYKYRIANYLHTGDTLP